MIIGFAEGDETVRIKRQRSKNRQNSENKNILPTYIKITHQTYHHKQDDTNNFLDFDIFKTPVCASGSFTQERTLLRNQNIKNLSPFLK